MKKIAPHDAASHHGTTLIGQRDRRRCLTLRNRESCWARGWWAACMMRCMPAFRMGGW